MVKSILDKNECKIINDCQSYLNEYEKGHGSSMTPDIDGILSWLYGLRTIIEWWLIKECKWM